MSVAPGVRFGPYEIIAVLGAGGMGEVYRARDARLNRTVAIKVLPAHVAADPQFRERFEREARAVAALNDPHICTLYDVGHQNGVDFLVMEYLEGETLADRISRGALPIDDVLRYAIEIADALDKAHRKAIVHRDLKPGNVMLTSSGVKLLDFGLAKLQAVGAVSSISAAATMTNPITAHGTILGTLHYMAPEQLEGKETDARADIFAFGAVLYEMVTGTKAFEGKSSASVIGAIMTADPQSLLELQPIAPKALEHVVRMCLAKNPDERWQSAADLRAELRWVAANRTVSETAQVRGKRSSNREIAAWSVAAVALVAAAVVWSSDALSSRPDAAQRETVHLPFATAPGVTPFHSPFNPGVAISPDGTQLVYAGSSQGERLYLQDLHRSGLAVPIPGTENALNPFFSSDGKWLAFVAHNKLQKVALSGGEPLILADADMGGGVWSPDDETIYFVPALDQGIWQIPSRGGKPVQVTKPDRDGFDNAHLWPAILPNGDRLLYTSAYGRNRIVILDLQTGKRTPIVENGFFGRYVSSGHVVFAQGQSLLAVSFDQKTLQVGHPVKVLDNIVTGHEQHAEYSISQTGTLVYFDGTSDFQRRLVRIDRKGAIERVAQTSRPYDFMRLSRDGRRLAVSLYDGQQDVFIYDVFRGDFDRITFDPHNDFNPRWSSDGRNLVFSSVRRGQLDLYVGPADKSSPEQLLYASDYPKWASSWSRDGKVLAFNEQRPETGMNIWMYSMDEKKARPFRNAAFNEWSPDFSPDGRSVAYASDELGRLEIYVVPYPAPGPTCKVSASGGSEPRWSEDGKELFYRQGTTAMVVDVANRNFCNATPRALFDGLDDSGDSWDVSPKGDFFMTLEPRESPRLHLVLNWFEELKRLVPVAK
jgi:serine/threonine protein kinase/WD40 repeat protein